MYCYILLWFFYAVDIVACASGKTDVVDETGSRLIGLTSRVLDRVDVSLWFQGV